MTHEAPTPRTIILIPAYQPGQALIDSTSQLIADQLTVVVVDDGSEDRYAAIFNQLDSRVHLVRHTTNQGKGVALKTGFRYIQQTWQRYVVITADADGQHHVADIKKMAQAYGSQYYVLLLGVRAFQDNSIPFRSRFGNVLTRRVFSLVTRQELSDTQTGLRAFDDSLIDFMLAVPGEHFEYEMNVLLACSREGIPLIEQPIKTIYEDGNQSSHFNPLKDSWSIYKQVIKFASVSLLSFIIDYVAFIVLLGLTNSWVLASSVIFANIISRVISASFNFTMNKHFIFKHKGSLAKNAAYYLVLAATILIGNTILLNFLTSTLHFTPYLAKILTEVSFFCLSYAIQKNMIFTNNKKGAYQI